MALPTPESIPAQELPTLTPAVAVPSEDLPVVLTPLAIPAVDLVGA